MLAIMEAKTKVYSVRIPLDLDQRLQRLKIEQAHKRVPNAEFLVEAIRLYIDHAERFGIDDNLIVREPIAEYKAERSKGGNKKSAAG